MAECILTISILYLLATQFGKLRTLSKYTLILQFFIGWLILELAWAHAVISGATILMALGDFDDWSFGTLVGVAITVFNITQFLKLHKDGENTHTEFEKTLPIGLGDNYLEHIDEDRRNTIQTSDANQWLKPFSFKHAAMESVHNITYGPNERNTLDLFKPSKDSDKPRPVMLQIHGGGWMLGYGERQGLPLRNKLISAGWVFVSINYRLSPKNKFPDHLVDCKQAVKWIKENISEHGGNPDFIMVTGGSAGGHLCSLTALTANQHQDILQPGFEDFDTSVQGCIPMYGVYDFKDRNEHRTDMAITEFLEKNVMPTTLNNDPELWDIASPIAQAHSNSPPFMVIHGENDTLSFCEDARYFVKALRETSESPCVYTELPCTQHAFDIFYSPRCIQTIEAMHCFAEYVYSDYLSKQ